MGTNQHELGAKKLSSAAANTNNILMPLSIAIHLYHLLDSVTGLVLAIMLIFSVWAFGATESWSSQVMNFGGLLLGLMWLGKLGIRASSGYQPPRWGEKTTYRKDLATPPNPLKNRITTMFESALGAICIAILLFQVVAILNAAATYLPEEYRFVYKPYIHWLPHTYDKTRSLDALFRTLALILTFWATKDWMLGLTRTEEREIAKNPNARPKYLLPHRVRRLIWLLTANGLLLALEGTVQRAAGSNKLLFVVTPTVHPIPEAAFGPFAYRANAAQYLNLVWPISVGLWWIYHRIWGTHRTVHYFLLLSASVMCAAVFVAGSRGGCIIAAAILASALSILTISNILLSVKRQISWQARNISLWFGGIFLVIAAYLGIGLGWRVVWPRMLQIKDGFVNRAELFNLAWPIFKEHKWFGTGPGSFEHVFQLYRPSADTYWPAQLHNDWLELLTTMGLVGTSLVLAGLLVIFLRWFFPGPIWAGARFTTMLWLALGGCVLHAAFDFPFQIYSVVFLFVIWCALLFNLSRVPATQNSD